MPHRSSLVNRVAGSRMRPATLIGEIHMDHTLHYLLTQPVHDVTRLANACAKLRVGSGTAAAPKPKQRNAAMRCSATASFSEPAATMGTAIALQCLCYRNGRRCGRLRAALEAAPDQWSNTGRHGKGGNRWALRTCVAADQKNGSSASTIPSCAPLQRHANAGT
jgi:hypothetical protein